MDKDREQTEAYPKPSEADKQLKNQPEFIDQQPNDFNDKSISNVSTTADRQNNDPGKDLKGDEKK